MRPGLIEGIVLDRPIGSGATSTVYLGYRQDNPKERFAIKFLSPLLGAQEVPRQRWLREADILIRLDHPNIVRGYRHGITDDRPYLVMEFLQGESLQDRLRRLGKLPVEQVYHVAECALKALGAAEALGVVHRDVKPANMIWLNDDSVKLMDFGLAKLAEPDVDLTATGAILGTPIYVSPEQAAGSDAITIQSDLYSLGTTLFHLACGRPPFAELNVSLLLTRKITDNVPDVRLYDREVGSALAYFIDQLCQRVPTRRPENAAKALKLLADIRSGSLAISDTTPVPISSRAPLREAPAGHIPAGSRVLDTVVGDKALNTRPVILRAEEVLFYEEDNSRECYLLVSGRVEVVKSGRVIATITEPGAFIGEMSPLNDVPRTATIVACEETVLLRIETEEFDAFFARHPEMLLMLARTLAARLEATGNKLNQANGRLAMMQRHVREMSAVLAGRG